MSPRREAAVGAAMAGLLLLSIPALDVSLGGAFDFVHVILSVCGVSFLVLSLRGGEA